MARRVVARRVGRVKEGRGVVVAQVRKLSAVVQMDRRGNGGQRKQCCWFVYVPCLARVV